MKAVVYKDEKVDNNLRKISAQGHVVMYHKDFKLGKQLALQALKQTILAK